ncbi:hypothetical protein LBMAG24_03870 [Bacteroidota bacterium]|nr:hypothetical protein LBMAG24_03870 [Bacteroidota bacterium]
MFKKPLVFSLFRFTFTIKNKNMETVKDTTKSDWVIFLVSLAGMIALLAYADEWFWLALPFVLTYFVKALKFM